jgi:hypothetical protein
MPDATNLPSYLLISNIHLNAQTVGALDLVVVLCDAVALVGV